MTLRGARTILVPAAFNMTTGPAHWELMFQGKSGGQSVLYDRNFRCKRRAGRIYLLGPFSCRVTLGGCGDTDGRETGIQITEIDLDRVDAIREQLHYYPHGERICMNWKGKIMCSKMRFLT